MAKKERKSRRQYERVPVSEEQLKHLIKNTIEAHKRYIERLEQKVAVDRAIAERKLRQATAEVKKQQAEYDKYLNLQLISLADYKQYHRGKLEQTDILLQAYKAS